MNVSICVKFLFLPKSQKNQTFFIIKHTLKTECSSNNEPWLSEDWGVVYDVRLKQLVFWGEGKTSAGSW